MGISHCDSGSASLAGHIIIVECVGLTPRGNSTGHFNARNFIGIVAHRQMSNFVHRFLLSHSLAYSFCLCVRPSCPGHSDSACFSNDGGKTYYSVDDEKRVVLITASAK